MAHGFVDILVHAHANRNFLELNVVDCVSNDVCVVDLHHYCAVICCVSIAQHFDCVIVVHDVDCKYRSHNAYVSLMICGWWIDWSLLQLLMMKSMNRDVTLLSVFCAVTLGDTNPVEKM